MLRDLKAHAAAAQSLFPRQHGPEARPTGIEDTLCHVGSNKFRCTYIADGDVLPHKLRRYRVQKILPPISYLGGK
jgi:hypothetical protein